MGLLLLLVSISAFGAAVVGGNVVFSMVDIVSSPSSFHNFGDQSNAGFLMAFQDAQQGKYGLFPNSNISLITRMLPSTLSLSSTQLIYALTDAVRLDNPVGIFGPHGSDAVYSAFLSVASSGVPEVSLTSDTNEKVLDGTYRETFIKLYPGRNHQTFALMFWLSMHNYTSIGVIIQASRLHTSTSTVLARNAAVFGIRVVTSTIMQPDTVDGLRPLFYAMKESDVRVFVVICDMSALKNVLLAADAQHMIGEGFIWTIPSAHGVAGSRDPTFLNLARKAFLIGTTVNPPNTTTTAYQDLNTRFKAMPRDASIFPSVDPSTGLTITTTFAYDSAMVLFRAVNATIAKGEDPTNRTIVLDEISIIDFEGVTGRVKYVRDDTLSGMLEIQQLRTDNTSTNLGLLNFVTMTFTPYTSVIWAGNTTEAPPNFTPDSCGPASYRSMNGTCLECPLNSINEPGDGQELCQPCPLGRHLVGLECILCSAGEVPYTDHYGFAQCASSSKKVDVSKIAGITFGIVLGAILVIASTVCAIQKFRNIQRKYEIAEKKAQDEGRFVAFVFHEIRNPLNGVVGSLEFVEETLRKLVAPRPFLSGSGINDSDSTSDNSDASQIMDEFLHTTLNSCLKDVDACMSCAGHTMDILNSVLDLSKINNGKLKLLSEPVCLRATVELVALMLGRVNPTVTIRPIVMLRGQLLNHEDSLFVLADSKRVKQVLLNLVLNAVQHTQGSGFVEVVVSVDEVIAQPSVVVVDFEMTEVKQERNLLNRTVTVKVEVRDNGEGICEDDQRKLFDLYGQASRGASANGTGLGLVLSKQFVGLMGGDLKVESPWNPEHSGTRFHFSFKTNTCTGSTGRESDRTNSCCEFPIYKDGDQKYSHPIESNDSLLELKTSSIPNPASGTAASKSLSQSSQLLLTTTTALLNPPPQSMAVTSMIPLLPVVAEQSLPTVSLPQVAHILDNLIVLIVDDVPMNRKILRRKLSSGPFQQHRIGIDEAETGEQCLELLHRGKCFDVIIMDQIMSAAGGQMLGSEAAIKIRRLEAEKSQPRSFIVACSGNSSKEDLELYLSAGMNRMLPKPLPEQSQFYEMLIRWISAHKLAV
jgi:signal transduction histidine kinase/CheY-like chemotaxis protein